MTTERPTRVLIVDDDESHAEALVDGLEMDGASCSVAHSGADGIARLSEQTFDAVLTDLIMPDRSGMDVLREAIRLQPDCAVLLVTGHESVRTAVEAMREGAADYLAKPVDLAELRTRLARAVEAVRLKRTNTELQRQIDKRFGFEGIVGQSPPMQRVFDVLGQVSSTNATVLILGESGTGKELAARAIHTNSPRSKRPFVAVNCAALSEELIESELFGHVKGAFTGADSAKEGRFVYANGGTMFLDEVGDMALPTQAKLLRVLETREVVPVGGNATVKIDVRLVSATNRDLEAMVKEGRFREDLLYRLKVVTLRMPSLRERRADLPLLIDHFTSEFARTHQRTIRGITPEARTILMRYDWPGNVRELRNALESMVVMSRSGMLDVEHMPDSVRTGFSSVERGHRGGYDLAGRSLAEVEKALIEVNLALCDRNREKTAKVLGMGERTLYRKLKEYGLG